MIRKAVVIIASIAIALMLLIPNALLAQPAAPIQSSSGIHLSTVPKNSFHPTCNLDSNSVGIYFFPPNLGAKWTLRTVSQVMDIHNRVLKSDTTFSFEHVISDSNRTLQGFPVLRCESSMPYHAGGEDTAKTQIVEYYIDDSVVMTVFNHSITNGSNHTMLVNPLHIGASWKDAPDDTVRTSVIATEEPVSTPLGDFSKSLVVQSPIEYGEMSKYFVKGVGIVKVVFRGIPPQQNGTFIHTSELVSLDRGNPKRSIKYRFGAAPTKKHSKKKSKTLKANP
jgi:hypothetical protein